MFRLGQHVGGDIGRPGAVIGDDQDLGGSGDHIDAHHPRHLALGLGDKLVARTDDDVDFGDGLGTEGEGGNRPGRADLVDFSDADLLRRHQQMGINLAAAVRRGYHDPSVNPGDAGRNAVHQHRRHQRGGAAPAPRHVESGGIDGPHQSADDAPVLAGLQPAVLHFPFVKSLDALDGDLEAQPEVRMDLGIGGLQFGSRYLQAFGRHLRRIETPAEFENGRILFRLHPPQDLLDGGPAGRIRGLKAPEQAGDDLPAGRTGCGDWGNRHIVKYRVMIQGGAAPARGRAQ